MAHCYPQALLLLVLLRVISECRDDSPNIVTVPASLEEDIVLPCFKLMDSKSCYRVKWTKYATNASQTKVILARPQTTNIKDAERVNWGADGNGQMSLFLKQLQQSDEGLYNCEIWLGWDSIHVKNIYLKVKECKALLPVKAVPSTAVNLNCPVDTPSGQHEPQNISWAMMKGEISVPINLSRVEINGTSLGIQSVSTSDFSWYRCKYMLGQTQRCFSINLVQVEEDVLATTVSVLTTTQIILEARKEESSGAFIAVVVSVITGLAIIAALIGLSVYCRRNTQRITELIQRNTPDTVTDSPDYEIVTLTSSENHTNQRVNSLYQQSQDENMCSFHY